MIKYRGGKSKEIPNIIWHIPRFSGRYIEPFLGGGALFFYLEPKKAIINGFEVEVTYTKLSDGTIKISDAWINQ